MYSSPSFLIFSSITTLLSALLFFIASLINHNNNNNNIFVFCQSTTPAVFPNETYSSCNNTNNNNKNNRIISVTNEYQGNKQIFIQDVTDCNIIITNSHLVQIRILRSNNISIHIENISFQHSSPSSDRVYVDSATKNFRSILMRNLSKIEPETINNDSEISDFGLIHFDSEMDFSLSSLSSTSNNNNQPAMLDISEVYFANIHSSLSITTAVLLIHGKVSNIDSISLRDIYMTNVSVSTATPSDDSRYVNQEVQAIEFTNDVVASASSSSTFFEIKNIHLRDINVDFTFSRSSDIRCIGASSIVDFEDFHRLEFSNFSMINIVHNVQVLSAFTSGAEVGRLKFTRTTTTTTSTSPPILKVSHFFIHNVSKQSTATSSSAQMHVRGFNPFDIDGYTVVDISYLKVSSVHLNSDVVSSNTRALVTSAQLYRKLDGPSLSTASSMRILRVTNVSVSDILLRGQGPQMQINGINCFAPVNNFDQIIFDTFEVRNLYFDNSGSSGFSEVTSVFFSRDTRSTSSSSSLFSARNMIVSNVTNNVAANGKNHVLYIGKLLDFNNIDLFNLTLSDISIFAAETGAADGASQMMVAFLTSTVTGTSSTSSSLKASQFSMNDFRMDLSSLLSSAPTQTLQLFGLVINGAVGNFQTIDLDGFDVSNFYMNNLKLCVLNSVLFTKLVTGNSNQESSMKISDFKLQNFVAERTRTDSDVYCVGMNGDITKFATVSFKDFIMNGVYAYSLGAATYVMGVAIGASVHGWLPPASSSSSSGTLPNLFSVRNFIFNNVTLKSQVDETRLVGFMARGGVFFQDFYIVEFVNITLRNLFSRSPTGSSGGNAIAYTMWIQGLLFGPNPMSYPYGRIVFEDNTVENWDAEGKLVYVVGFRCSYLISNFYNFTISRMTVRNIVSASPSTTLWVARLDDLTTTKLMTSFVVQDCFVDGSFTFRNGIDVPANAQRFIHLVDAELTSGGTDAKQNWFLTAQPVAILVRNCTARLHSKFTENPIVIDERYAVLLKIGWSATIRDVQLQRPLHMIVDNSTVDVDIPRASLDVVNDPLGNLGSLFYCDTKTLERGQAPRVTGGVTIDRSLTLIVRNSLLLNAKNSLDERNAGLSLLELSINQENLQNAFPASIIIENNTVITNYYYDSPETNFEPPQPSDYKLNNIIRSRRRPEDFTRFPKNLFHFYLGCNGFSPQYVNRIVRGLYDANIGANVTLQPDCVVTETESLSTSFSLPLTESDELTPSRDYLSETLTKTMEVTPPPTRTRSKIQTLSRNSPSFSHSSSNTIEETFSGLHYRTKTVSISDNTRTKSEIESLSVSSSKSLPIPPPPAALIKKVISGMETAAVLGSQLSMASPVPMVQAVKTVAVMSALGRIARDDCDFTNLYQFEYEAEILARERTPSESPLRMRLPWSGGGHAGGTVVGNVIWIILSWLTPLLLWVIYEKYVTSKVKEYAVGEDAKRKKKFEKKQQQKLEQQRDRQRNDDLDDDELNFKKAFDGSSKQNIPSLWETIQDYTVDSRCLFLFFFALIMLSQPSLMAGATIFFIDDSIVATPIKILIAILGSLPPLILICWIIQSLFRREPVEAFFTANEEKEILDSFEDDDGDFQHRAGLGNFEIVLLENEVDKMKDQIDEMKGSSRTKNKNKNKKSKNKKSTSNQEQPSSTDSNDNEDEDEDDEDATPRPKEFCFIRIIRWLNFLSGEWRHLKVDYEAKRSRRSKSKRSSQKSNKSRDLTIRNRNTTNKKKNENDNNMKSKSKKEVHGNKTSEENRKITRDEARSFYFALPLMESYTNRMSKFVAVDVGLIISMPLCELVSVWFVGSCVAFASSLIAVCSIHFLLSVYYLPFTERISRSCNPLLSVFQIVVLGLMMGKVITEDDLALIQLILISGQLFVSLTICAQVLLDCVARVKLVLLRKKLMAKCHKLKKKVRKLKKQQQQQQHQQECTTSSPSSSNSSSSDDDDDDNNHENSNYQSPLLGTTNDQASVEMNSWQSAPPPLVRTQSEVLLRDLHDQAGSNIKTRQNKKVIKKIKNKKKSNKNKKNDENPHSFYSEGTLL